MRKLEDFHISLYHQASQLKIPYTFDHPNSIFTDPHSIIRDITVAFSELNRMIVLLNSKEDLKRSGVNKLEPVDFNIFIDKLKDTEKEFSKLKKMTEDQSKDFERLLFEVKGNQREKIFTILSEVTKVYEEKKGEVMLCLREFLKGLA